MADARIANFCGRPDSHDPHDWRVRAQRPSGWWCPGLPIRRCSNTATHSSHRWNPSDVNQSITKTRWCDGFTQPGRAEPARTEPTQAVDELRTWWERLANTEADRVVPKAVEYGADDLVEIGRELILAGVRMPANVASNGTQAEADEIYAELGIWFYLVGKMARWRSAVRRGERVSDDSLHDIGVYARMAQRVRETGRWP